MLAAGPVYDYFTPCALLLLAGLSTVHTYSFVLGLARLLLGLFALNRYTVLFRGLVLSGF
jgi:hypothetical protein